MNIEKYISKKLLAVILGFIGLLLDKIESWEFISLLGVYVGVQGWIDRKK